MCVCVCVCVCVCIYCHSQTYCFVVSQLFSVARDKGRFKLESKLAVYMHMYVCVFWRGFRESVYACFFFSLYLYHDQTVSIESASYPFVIIYIYIYICIYIRRQLHKNAASNVEQVLAATPHKEPTIRPPASYHKNYPG